MYDRRDLMRGLLAGGVAAAGTGAVAGRGLAQSPEASPDAPEAPWTAQGIVRRSAGLVHWVSVGEGPPVVMMPKLGGWVADWRHVAALLADRYRVIVIDPPGHGGSQMAAPAPFIQTLPESATMVRSALKEMGIDRYAFAGNSLGGCIGIVMAALFPQDMTHLVVLSSSLAAGVGWDEVPANDAQKALSGNFDEHWNPLPRSFAEMNGRFGLTRQIHDEMNASRAIAGQWIRASERGVLVADMPAYLPRIAARTLLVYGSTGPYLQFRAIGERLVPDVQAVAIRDSGSFMHQQDPQRTAAILAGHLAALDA